MLNHLSRNLKLYTIVREIQTDFPFVTLGGSLALWLYGYQERGSSDIDLIVHSPSEMAGLIKIYSMVKNPRSTTKYSNNEENYLQSSQLVYKDSEICFFIRPDIKVHSERLENIQVQAVEQILDAKIQYARKKSGKHVHDLDKLSIAYEEANIT